MIYHETEHGILYNGESLEVLRTLPDNSVNCCVTSPPYWGLRDYGCNGQLGLERAPEEYVARIVEIFREVRRVLRKDGTLWLNLGDSYLSDGTKEMSVKDGSGIQADQRANNEDYRKTTPTRNARYYKNTNLKRKDLVGIPWRVAFALQADGWYLRQDIIWHKPNPMPESVTDRCTKAHEYVFLMSKSAKYYYDADAVKESVTNPDRTNYQCGSRTNGENQDRNDNDMASRTAETIFTKRNRRSVWTVTTKPFKEAHFATFPRDLIRPMIQAGCPADGVVLDPFMGSGTTAIEAIYQGKRYIGIDLNPDYCAMAAKRIDAEIAQTTIDFS